MNILVTGGTGYIGSHTAIELINQGHSVTIVDNLVNSSMGVLERIERITGTRPPFYNIDLCNESATRSLFAENEFDAVIHFAGLKAVGESVQRPLKYYRNNLISSISLVEAMSEHGVKKLVFSSSATVYGDPGTSRYTESLDSGHNISSPYGQTKHMIEQILKDASLADPSLEITILRYFNPIGAHESGTIGEDPMGIPNNLMPFISQVAVGRRKELKIFGKDYKTPDGTCRRDYIHVVDLAQGHVAALHHSRPGTDIYNLGSGKLTSVLELLTAFSKATGKEVPHTFTNRRVGDLAEFYADPTKAKRELSWYAKLDIEDMCHDTWNWQKNNPNGYEK